MIDYCTYPGKIDCILALGTIIDYDNPFNTRVNEDEIYIHLKNICRYNGAVKWSLLNHSYLCSKLIDTIQFNTDDSIQSNKTIQAGYAAIHDFSEVYVGDVVTALKHRLPDYKILENDFDVLAHDHFGLPLRNKNEVWIKAIDLAALAIEMQYTNHPAAKLIQKRISYIPTKADIDLCRDIRWMTPERQWEQLCECIGLAHGYLNIEHRRLNGSC